MKPKYLAMTVPVLLGLGLFNVTSVEELKERVGESMVKVKVLNISDVRFSDKARSNLYHIYKDVKNEIPFCLYGSVNGRNVYVHNVEMPLIFDNGEGGVLFDRKICDSPDYIGMAHNHKGDCLPSNVDMKRFTNDKQAEIELIVCGVGKKNGQMDIAAYLADKR